MIELKKISIENFCNIKKTELDLSHFVTILQGSNGQGKSAVVDAISLCISDKKRSGKMSDYIRQGQDSSHIILEAALYDKPMVVDLSIAKLNNRTITYDGKTYKNTEAAEFLKKQEFDYYADLMFMLQNEEDLSQLSPVNRAEYLKKLLNFDFTDQIETVNNDIDQLKTITSNAQKQIDLLTNNVSNFKSHIEQPEQPIDESIITEKETQLKQLEKEAKRRIEEYKTLCYKVAKGNYLL